MNGVSVARLKRSLVLTAGQAHTLDVPEEGAHPPGNPTARPGCGSDRRAAGNVAAARPSRLDSLDPTRLDRIRARFAPARVVELAKSGITRPRPDKPSTAKLRPGDRVSKGDLLGVFYSVDVGSKKNDLLDALVQLELDQKILDDAEKHVEAFRKSSCSPTIAPCKATATPSTGP